MSHSTARRLFYFFGGLAAVAAFAAVVAIRATRASETQADAARRRAQIDAGVRAMVVPVVKRPPVRHVVAQGEARPYASVTLYAKVSGYLREVKADRGDEVRPNQVLAVIQSPELDRQLDAAQADAAFKRANAKRSAGLAGPGVVSAREAELDSAQAQVADANLAALASQRSYTLLRAPFRGTVTARFADPGALVQNAASAQTGALPVVTVSQLDRLRVFAYLDQRDAALVKVGDPVEVSAPEQGVTVAGKVTRTGGELDPRTRTLLVEIDLDNKERKILPGSFVTVSLVVKGPSFLEIPVDALAIREGKSFVVVLAAGDRAELRPVTIAQHDGAKVAVASGLKEGERVALNVGRNVAAGDRIVPVVPAAAGGPGAAK